eukprot:5666138-Pyramimonas_sp.AAC.1
MMIALAARRLGRRPTMTGALARPSPMARSPCRTRQSWRQLLTKHALQQALSLLPLLRAHAQK